MKKFLNILKFVIFYPWFPLDQLNIGPLAIAGIGAGIGALGNMLGESEEEKRNQMLKKKMEALNAMRERFKQQAAEDRKSSSRMYSGMIGERRGNLNQKLAQYGMNPSGSVYSNEKDLIDANLQERENIDKQQKEMESQISYQIDNINSEMVDEPSMFEKGLSGGISGFKQGLNLSSVLPGVNSPGGSATKPITKPVTSGINTGNINQGVTNPDMIDPTILPDVGGEDGTGQMGNLTPQQLRKLLKMRLYG